MVRHIDRFKEDNYDPDVGGYSDDDDDNDDKGVDENIGDMFANIDENERERRKEMDGNQQQKHEQDQNDIYDKLVAKEFEKKETEMAIKDFHFQLLNRIYIYLSEDFNNLRLEINKLKLELGLKLQRMYISNIYLSIVAVLLFVLLLSKEPYVINLVDNIFNKTIKEGDTCVFYCRGMFNEKLYPSDSDNTIIISNSDGYFRVVPNGNGISFQEMYQKTQDGTLLRNNFVKFHKENINNPLILDGSFFDECSVFTISSCQLTEGVSTLERITMYNGPCYKIKTCNNSYLKSVNGLLSTTFDSNDRSNRFVMSCLNKEIKILGHKDERNGVGIGSSVEFVEKSINKETTNNEFEFMFGLDLPQVQNLIIASYVFPNLTPEIKDKILNIEKEKEKNKGTL